MTVGGWGLLGRPADTPPESTLLKRATRSARVHSSRQPQDLGGCRGLFGADGGSFVHTMLRVRGLMSLDDTHHPPSDSAIAY